MGKADAYDTVEVASTQETIINSLNAMATSYNPVKLHYVN